MSNFELEKGPPGDASIQNEMENQIKANQKRIQLIQSENQKLISALGKYKNGFKLYLSSLQAVYIIQILGRKHRSIHNKSAIATNIAILMNQMILKSWI